MENMEKANAVYRYQPTETGFRVRSEQPQEPMRSMVCALYPDCDKTNVYDSDELDKMDLWPFRPAVCAALSPRYYLDMHCISGLSGYGRFAVVVGGKSKWLDEFEELETELINGELHYCARDSFVSGAAIRVAFLPTAGAVGLVGCVDCSELGEDIKVYYIHGGMLGWNWHNPPILSYSADMCWGNAVTLQEEGAEIVLGGKECEFVYPGLKEIEEDKKNRSMSCAWLMLEGLQRKLIVRAEDALIRIASPEALIAFDESELLDYNSVNGGLVCARFLGGSKHYFAVGRGTKLESGCLKDLFEDSRKEIRRISEKLVIQSGDPALDGAVRIGAYATHALYGDNVLLHGNLMWRYGYVGWRVSYGPMAYGMREQVYKHFDKHMEKSWIKEGPDKGAVMHMLEHAAPDARTFYNMYETFTDQAKKFWEYTGDRDFAARLLPVVEGCIDREIRRLKPGEEWLFENSLNTWISDSHWTIEGQCTQASSYMYNMFRLAAELADTSEKQEKYAELANCVKADMFRVLWQPKKGIFGYAQELRGNQLFHGEPELADIYHPAEFGVTDKYQTYQMLDWVEANLYCGPTDNGGKLYWSSNWHPNSGETYTHSIKELNMGEEMNLALIYHQLGLAEEGYEIFKTTFMAVFSGRDPGIRDQDLDIYAAKGHLPFHTEVAADFPCQVSINGTPRRNPLFGDSISMFGRAAYNGVLGVKPMLNKGEIQLSPCVPKELPDIDVKSELIDYHYERKETSICIDYAIKQGACNLKVIFNLPVAQIHTVEVAGKPIPYQTEPNFGGIRVHAMVENTREGRICVNFETLDVNPLEERRTLRRGTSFALDYPGEAIDELLDPQGMVAEVSISGGQIKGMVAGEPGSGVFFLQMRVGQTDYIRPVKWWIEPEVPAEEKIFRSFKEEFDGPYEWSPVDMDALFSAGSPEEAMDAVCKSVIAPPKEYSQVNLSYYKTHLTDFNWENITHPMSDKRWRSLVDESGMVMTGEGIPFRSRKEGAYMAVTTMSGTAYPDRVTVQVDDAGRAAYLLITGVTYPMQSHVENVRVTFEYEDGVREEYPLVSPFDIGDMWYTLYDRFHDTPANGFENMSGRWGEMSSAGLDLSGPILTDTEAHILRFRLRPDVKVRTVEMRTIANDVIFALMGVTLLK